MAGCGVNGFLTGRPDGFPWRCCISMKGKPEYGLVVPEEQSALPVFDTTVRSRSIYAFLKGRNIVSGLHLARDSFPDVTDFMLITNKHVCMFVLI